MRTGGAMLLVAVGLFVLWIVTTGKLQAVVEAWDHITGSDQGTMGGAAGGAGNMSGPRIAAPPPVLTVSSRNPYSFNSTLFAGLG